MEKLILDACCGSRMFWFDKNNPLVLFQDIRNETLKKTNGHKLEIKPDVVGDFRNMTYKDCSFKHVIMDFPHRTDVTKGNWMDNCYGTLFPTWQEDLRLGFKEGMRVLDYYGILIVKWNTKQISVKKLIEVIGHQPLYGHTTGTKTIWLCFMKLPTH